jgi:hypothetical protein
VFNVHDVYLKSDSTKHSNALRSPPLTAFEARMQHQETNTKSRKRHGLYS